MMVIVQSKRRLVELFVTGLSLVYILASELRTENLESNLWIQSFGVYLT